MLKKRLTMLTNKSNQRLSSIDERYTHNEQSYQPYRGHDTISQYSRTELTNPRYQTFQQYEPYYSDQYYQPYLPNQLLLPNKINQKRTNIEHDDYQPPAYDSNQKFSEIKNVDDICNKYEISDYIKEDLKMASSHEIILICDDSGSMRTPSDYGKTRWDELKDVSEIIIDIAGILDSSGIDIYFLNREDLLEVKSSKYLKTFNDPPTGSTPLTKCLAKVMDKKTIKPKLIIIATDGLPTNGSIIDTTSFSNLLKSRDSINNKICILACTNQNDVMEFLNKLDKTIDHLDVIDDYQSEKKEVLAVQGKHTKYSFGDHICRLILSPIIPEYDLMDEKKLIFDTCGNIIKSNTLVHKKRVKQNYCNIL